MMTKTKYLALANRVRELDRAYYDKDDPIATDAEYDSLKHQLEAAEKEHPDWAQADSPSARPGGSAVKGRKVPHKIPLLSLQDYFSQEDLKAWYERSGSPEVTVEQKIDGLTLALVYRNNNLVLGATRGDGTIGEDVTANVAYIQGIPLELPVINNVNPDNNTIAIRVEVYQPVAAFRACNKSQEEQGLEPFANPRNCAAGGLRADDPEVTRSRGLAAFAFRILYAEGWDTAGARERQSADLDILRCLGFQPVEHTVCKASDFHAILAAISRIDESREGLPYWIDGAVVKTNRVEAQNALGQGSKYPSWAAAYKYPAEKKQSRVLNIRVQTGRTGVLTPVAEIEPVQLAGTTVSNVTLHNQKFIDDHKINIGCLIEVIKSGEIIPKVAGVPEPADTPYRITRCPVCGAEAVERTDQDGRPTGIMACPDSAACPAQALRYLEFFCSKDVMDIRGMGPSVIKTLYDAGLVRSAWDIYDLPYKLEHVAALDGFGQKKAENLAKAVTKSKDNDIDRLIKALGIPGVGRHIGKMLAKRYPDMASVRRLGIDTLMSLDSIGEVTARDIESAWGHGKKELLDKLEAKGVNMRSKSYKDPRAASKADVGGATGPLAGMSIVATGTIDGFSRTGIEAFIEQHGGKASGSVSKKTSCVIAGSNAGSKLQKAESLGIPVYDIQAFRAKYGI